MKQVLKVIALIVVIAVLVFAGYKLFFEKEAKEETEIIKANQDKTGEEGDSDKKEAALPVKAIKVERGNLPLRLNISATADVWEKAVIRSELSGTIEDIKVTVGDWVSKGQLLVKLDDEERKLEVEQREAEKLKSYSDYLVKESTESAETEELSPEQRKELETLKQRYQQAVKDVEKRKISQKDFEKISDDYQKVLIFSGDLRDEVRRAQEGLTTAIVYLKQAEFNLKRTTVRSPFPGAVAELRVSKGEKVSVGQELLKVVNLGSLYLKGYALESEIANLKEGIRVRVKFDAFGDRFFYGEIQSISPEIDAERKTITVYIKIDNRDRQFMPGMHAEIDVEYTVFENVIKVPRNAVIFRQDRYLVFVVKELKGTTGVANWQYVEIGHQNDEEIEILSGVQEGDMVLIEGHATLAHQSKVKLVK
jgi:membrane fusion protein (multidrug efflux system)